MAVDGTAGDDEPLPDVAVAQSFRDEEGDLAFPGGQRAGAGRNRARFGFSVPTIASALARVAGGASLRETAQKVRADAG